MRGEPENQFFSGERNDFRRNNKFFSVAGHVFLLLLCVATSYLLIFRLGTNIFVMSLIGVFFGSIFALLSFRDLTFPFFVWILSVGGFRFIWSIQAPGLPDLFLDRMMMIWLTIVFMIRFFLEGRRPRSPYVLDFFLLVNALYILVDIIYHGMAPFHDWTMSYLVPYPAYFFAKNLLTSRKKIRIYLWVLLGLMVYYSITSVAEKFNINALVWPKEILLDERWLGRSGGPFRHPPLFGVVLGMMIPLHLYFMTTVRSTVFKALLYMSLALSFAGIYFTYTRGSWLAGVMALLAVVFLNRRHYLSKLLPAAILVPFIAISFLGIGQDKFMKARVENEDTLGSRVGTLVTALKVWRANPIFGVGFYNYRFVIQDYVEPLNVPILGMIRVAQFRHNPPHDIYFGLLAETGAVGVFLQGSIYLIILRAFLRRYRGRKKGDEFAELVLPVFAGVWVGYLVGGLGFDFKFFSFVGTLFYTCAGILYGYRPEDYYGVEKQAEFQEGHDPLLVIPGGDRA